MKEPPCPICNRPLKHTYAEDVADGYCVHFNNPKNFIAQYFCKHCVDESDIVRVDSIDINKRWAAWCWKCGKTLFCHSPLVVNARIVKNPNRFLKEIRQ